MKSQFEKYAKLQQTIWPKYATTTLGNLPADKASIIDAEYDKVIDMEANGVVPAITEPTEKTEKGEAVNISVETPTDPPVASEQKVGGETETPSDNVDPVGNQGPVDGAVSEPTSADVASGPEAVAAEVNETPAVASEMADTETGFDDEVKAGE